MMMPLLLFPLAHFSVSLFRSWHRSRSTGLLNARPIHGLSVNQTSLQACQHRTSQGFLEKIHFDHPTFA
jgi:hypothetical protein